MKSLLTTAAALTAVCSLSTSVAWADSHDGHNHSHGSSYGPSGGYSYSPTSYYSNQPTYVSYPSYPTTSYPTYPTTTYRPPRPTAVWHDTTHIDVTPGRWVYGPGGPTYLPPQRTLHVDGHFDSVPTHRHRYNPYYNTSYDGGYHHTHHVHP